MLSLAKHLKKATVHRREPLQNSQSILDCSWTEKNHRLSWLWGIARQFSTSRPFFVKGNEGCDPTNVQKWLETVQHLAQCQAEHSEAPQQKKDCIGMTQISQIHKMGLRLNLTPERKAFNTPTSRAPLLKQHSPLFGPFRHQWQGLRPLLGYGSYNTQIFREALQTFVG